jgi:nucleotide-binding universal stress UspA family protein
MIDAAPAPALQPTPSTARALSAVGGAVGGETVRSAVIPVHENDDPPGTALMDQMWARILDEADDTAPTMVIMTARHGPHRRRLVFARCVTESLLDSCPWLARARGGGALMANGGGQEE